MHKDELKILIVDDDKDDLLLADSLLRNGLKGVALEVDGAVSFDRAQSQVAEKQYDLVLLDYRLGEKSGLDLLREIRSQGRQTPVVFLTGQGDEEVAVEAMKLGAADYLPKSKLSESLVGRSVRNAIELREKESLRQRTEEELRASNLKRESWVTELEERSRESSLLNELGKDLQGCVRLEAAYQTIGDHLSRFYPGRSGALCMFDVSRTRVEAAAVWGRHPPEKREFTPEDCWGLRREHHVRVRSAGTQHICPHLEGSGWKGHLCLPITAYGETLGVLVLEVSDPAEGTAGQPPPGAMESRRRFAETLCEQLALSLANLKLRESLRNQALRDPLTAMFNRRYLEDVLDRTVASAVRHKRPLAVLMLDLDHFKKFTDAYGQEAGDTLVRSVGQLLHLSTRAEDMVCRYGGDEFVVVLAEVPLGVAVQRAEQLRKLFAQGPPPDSGWHSMPTISVGVAAVPEHGTSAPSLLRTSLAALCRAKAQGRDCVAVGEAHAPGGDSVSTDELLVKARGAA
jgi:diguanylate cyclase (GGDEF)-like protein